MQLSRSQLRRRLEAEAQGPNQLVSVGSVRPVRVSSLETSKLQVADAQRLIENICKRSESRRPSLQSVPSLPPLETQACASEKEDEMFSEEFQASEKTDAFDVFLEFVYVRRTATSPYDLELVPFAEELNYATLSPAGLTHYVHGEPKSFVPLQRWLNERRSYHALRQLRFFQDFPAQKAFISWRSAGRRGRMVKAGQVLEERIFALHPWFSNTYAVVMRMFQDVANFRCLRSYFAQPLTLREFQVAQQNWQHDLFEKAKHVAQKLQSEVFGIFLQVVEHVRRETCRNDFTRSSLVKTTGARPVPGIIRAGMPKDESDALESLGFSKDVSFAQRPRLVRECARLLRFARVVDLLCMETLVEVMQASALDIYVNICEKSKARTAEGGLDEGWHGHLIFQVKAELELDEANQCLSWRLQPGEETLYFEFMRWLREGCGLASYFLQHATCNELEAYRFMMRSGARAKDRDKETVSNMALDAKLFDQLSNQETWQLSSARLAATLHTTFSDVQQKFRLYDGHLNWCYKCQRTDIRQLVQSLWNSGDLDGLNQMLHDYKEGLLSLDHIPTKHFIRPLEVEISGVISELKSSGSRCLSHLKEELPQVLLRCAVGIFEWMSSKTRHLSKESLNLAEFVSDVIVLKEVKLNVSGQVELLKNLKKLEQILLDHRLFISQSIQVKCSQVPRSFADFEQLIADKDAQVNGLRAGFLETFAQNLRELSEQVELFGSEEYVRHPELLQFPDDIADFGGMDEVETKLRELLNLQKWLSQLQERLDTYMGYQEVLTDISSDQFCDLSDAWLQLSRRCDLWRTYHEWLTKCSLWLPADLLSTDLVKISLEAAALWTRASQAQTDLPENRVFENLRRQLLYLQDLIPMLEVLQNPHLRSRHWAALSHVLDLKVGKDGAPLLTFGQAVSWNLGAFLPELLAVANRATQEHHIEVALEHLTDIWGGMELPIERNEDGIGFASLQLLQDELAKSQQLVAAAFASAVHGDRAKPWQARFEKVQELLEEISFCQERWALLDETFSTKKKKVSEVAAFQKLDSNWKALLSRLQFRNVIEVALDQCANFRQLREAMESISRNLQMNP
ncbi:unnamed protein product [Durusdinium trenchii]|uniref:Dynein heavy chain linker domain-containing protein n=1 Tax=Durusdinium trenchii TaxID=1381693 RepID=A0ABP0KMZ5_9DINO